MLTVLFIVILSGAMSVYRSYKRKAYGKAWMYALLFGILAFTGWGINTDISIIKLFAPYLIIFVALSFLISDWLERHRNRVIGKS